MEYFQNYYITPHTRISPYIIGLLFGYYIFKQNKRKAKINKFINVSAWIVSLIVMICTVVYSHKFHEENHDYNRIEACFYLTFGRTLWTLALVWIIWSCKNGYGGQTYLNIIKISLIYTYCRFSEYNFIVALFSCFKQGDLWNIFATYNSSVV